MHGGGRYGHYKQLVFRSKIDKYAQFVSAAGFGAVSQSGGLQADPRKREVGPAHVSALLAIYICIFLANLC